MTAMTTEVLGLPRGRALTGADLGAMPDDGHRYELVDGILLVSPAPRFIHQVTAGNVYTALRAACPPHLLVIFAPFDVTLSGDTVIAPDVFVAPTSSFTDRDLPAAPLLAVEVLSPSTKGVDTLLKKDRLRRAGCAHYWIVDPDEPSVTVWSLRAKEYELAGHATGDQHLTITEPVDLSLTPAELIRPV